MISANTVRIQNKRVHTLIAQPICPGKESCLVRLYDFVRVRYRLVVKVDVDRKPFAGRMVRDRKHSDEMIRLLAREMTLELLDRYHIGAELPPLFYRQHNDRSIERYRKSDRDRSCDGLRVRYEPPGPVDIRQKGRADLPRP